jgi:indole-3-glycerol phosphate synthase
MNILDQIIASKKKEIALKKSIVSVAQLEKSDLFNKKTNSLSKSIINSPFGIIAEHKRRSPSKATINNNFAVEDVV